MHQAPGSLGPWGPPRSPYHTVGSLPLGKCICTSARTNQCQSRAGPRLKPRGSVVAGLWVEVTLHLILFIVDIAHFRVVVGCIWDLHQTPAVEEEACPAPTSRESPGAVDLIEEIAFHLRVGTREKGGLSPKTSTCGFVLLCNE